MNKQTLILVAAIGLILIPTGVALHAFSVDRFEQLTQEGGTAFCVAGLDVADADKGKSPIPQPMPNHDVPNPSECKCNGTGKVKSGDGLITLPCPCGPTCKCQKFPKDVGPEVKTLKNRIVLLTATRRCSPCIQIDRTTLPALKAVGWTFGEKANIEVIDVDANPNHPYILDLEVVPTWLVLDGDGKILRTYEGYINATGMGRVFRAEDLQPGDDILREYKIEKKKTKSVKWQPFRLPTLKGERSAIVLSFRE